MNLQSPQSDDDHLAFLNAVEGLLHEARRDNGSAATALTAVTIESKGSNLELCMSLHFANGYEISHLFSPYEVRAFCAERGLRSRRELQEVLLEEALPIYERIGGEEWEPEEEIAAVEVAGEENVSILEIGTPAARERGFRLLFLCLTPLQCEQLTKKGYFEVIGGETGRAYRIRRGRVMNIDQLDRKGRRVCSWCFHPKGQIVTGDIMLAQKLALELDEKATLRIAGRERSRSRIPREAAIDE